MKMIYMYKKHQHQGYLQFSSVMPIYLLYTLFMGRLSKYLQCTLVVKNAQAGLKKKQPKKTSVQ